ncbi:MAG: alkaline phosphatase family protein, partial [Candidatus Thermoplasmatota archaeon]|nr:alkaline phosphatase family protein [Candidatus Thermoplasmatota archaeon]
MIFILGLFTAGISLPVLFMGPSYPEDLFVEPPEEHEPMASSTLLIILDGLPAYVMEDPDMMPNLANNWSSHGSTLKVTTGEMTLTGACTKELSTGRYATPIDAARNWEVTYDGKDDPFHYAEEAGIDVAFTGFYVWTNLFPGEQFEHETVYDKGFSDVYEGDNETLSNVERWIEKDREGIMIAHLGGTDHAGHIWGINTTEYREKALILDAQLEEIRQNAPSDWAVMFTADHGMTRGGGHAISTGEAAMAVNLYATGPPFLAGAEQEMTQRDISSIFLMIHDLKFPVSADARIPLDVFAIDNTHRNLLEQWNWDAAVERQNWMKENGFNHVDVSKDNVDWDIIPTEPFNVRWVDIFGSFVAVFGIALIAWSNRGDKFVLDRKAVVSFSCVLAIWLTNHLLYFQLYDSRIFGHGSTWYRIGLGIVLPAFATLLILLSTFNRREKWPNVIRKGFTWIEERTSHWFPLALLAISLWQPDARLSPSLFCFMLALFVCKPMNLSERKSSKNVFRMILIISLFPIWNHISSLITGRSLQKLTKIDFLYKFELQLVNLFMTENWIFCILLIVLGVWLASRIVETKRNSNWWIDATILSSVTVLHSFGNSWTDRIIILGIIVAYSMAWIQRYRNYKIDNLNRELTLTELGTMMLIIPTWGAWPAMVLLLFCRTIVHLFKYEIIHDGVQTNWTVVSRYLATATIPFFLLCIMWTHFGQLTMLGLIEFNPSKLIVTGGFFGARTDPPIIWMGMMIVLP